jgi:hypothetical protein
MPGPKGSPRPAGDSARESLENRLRGGKRRTAARAAGAPSGLEWSTVDRQRVHKEVWRLQVRIAQAVREEDPLTGRGAVSGSTSDEGTWRADSGSGRCPMARLPHEAHRGLPRSVKIRGDANPLDPRYDDHLRRRFGPTQHRCRSDSMVADRHERPNLSNCRVGLPAFGLLEPCAGKLARRVLRGARGR